MHPVLILLVVRNLRLLGSPPFDLSPKPTEKKRCYRVWKCERVTFEVICFSVALKTILFSVGTKYGEVTHHSHQWLGFSVTCKELTNPSYPNLLWLDYVHLFEKNQPVFQILVRSFVESLLCVNKVQKIIVQGLKKTGSLFTFSSSDVKCLFI